MRFAKAHALGNDFIIVSCEEAEGLPPRELARKICDRRTGVGADGLICYRIDASADRARFSQRIFNADGSEAQISGNGLRCLAAYLLASGLADRQSLVIETLAGARGIRLIGAEKQRFDFETDMGEPRFSPEEIPAKVSARDIPIVDYPLSLGDAQVRVTLLSMGNPHCCVFVDDLNRFDWKNLGARIEHSEIFPERTNVEFVKVLDEGQIEVRFWERGVGETLASGTGACAAAVASALNGFTREHVRVRAAGGELKVRWKDRRSVSLIGPAEIICTGEYFI